MAYASTDELRVRYPDLPELDEEYMEVRLEDASRAINRAIKPYGGPCAFDEDLLGQVCCDIAARSMYPSAMGLGMDVSQFSTTVGSISEQVTFNTSGGNCRLLRSDRENLGITGGRVGSVFIGS